MNTKRISFAIIALSILGLAAMASAQGLYWESTMTGAPMGERHQQMWIVPKMMKAQTTETGEAFVVRLDKELFITIDPKEKTYSEITFDDMEKALNKVNPKMAEMQKKLAALPEAQRKMMEKMMPGMGKTDAKMDVKSTGDKKEISGFNCTKSVITQDDKDMMTVWTTKDVSGFDSMRKDWEQFSKRMMALNPMAGKGLGEAFQKIEGFPIQTEMGHGMVSTVTKVEKKTASASEFEVPAGYKKVKSPILEGMDKMDQKDQKDQKEETKEEKK